VSLVFQTLLLAASVAVFFASRRTTRRSSCLFLGLVVSPPVALWPFLSLLCHSPRHCCVTLPSLLCHFTVIAALLPSLLCHFTVTAVSLYCHLAVTLSLGCYSTVTWLLLYCHLAVTLLSLGCYSTVTWLLLYCHFAVISAGADAPCPPSTGMQHCAEQYCIVHSRIITRVTFSVLRCFLTGPVAAGGVGETTWVDAQIFQIRRSPAPEASLVGHHRDCLSFPR